MPVECFNCKPICDCLLQGNEPNEAQLKILRFITSYREQHELMEPCFGKICMPLLMVIGEKNATRSNQE